MPSPTITTRESFTMQIQQLELDPDNVRSVFNDDSIKELAQSILSVGLLQPLVTRDGEDNRVIVVDGARRLLALRQLVADKKLAKSAEVLCVDATAEQRTPAMMLVANLQREDITPTDEARGYMRLVSEFKVKQGELAKMVGKAPSHITKRIALLQLPAEVQAAVDHGKVGLAEAYDISRLVDDKVRAKLCKVAVNNPDMLKYDLPQALRTQDQRAEAAKLTAWLEAHSIEVVPTPEYGSRRELEATHRLVGYFDKDSIVNYAPKKGDQVHRDNKNSLTVQVWTKLTKKELDARAAAAELDDGELSEAEVSELDPYERWEYEGERAIRAYEDARHEYRDKRRLIASGVLLGLKGRELAKIVIQTVLASVGRITRYEASNVLRALGQDSAVEDQDKVVLDWIGSSTERGLIAWLLVKADLTGDGSPIERELADALDAEGIIAPVEPVLGPEPWQDDDGNWVTDRERPISDDEQAAIDQVQAEAAAAQREVDEINGDAPYADEDEVEEGQ